MFPSLPAVIRGWTDTECPPAQEQEVSVLFCDIRGFSRVAERLGPRVSCQLVGTVMDSMTARVGAREGIVVDYYGDGLLAMWNAPQRQKDHAIRACRSALDMQAEVPGLSVAWCKAAGAPLNLGIAINSGPAMVGNTGSKHQVKYGPMGHTVNLAQRLQCAIRHLEIPVLITGGTHVHLPDTWATRRLCRAFLPSIHNEVDLYQLHSERADDDWRRRRDAFEEALLLFESGQWGATCRALYALLSGQEGNYDLPSLHLVSRAIDCLKSPPDCFCPVLDLSGTEFRKK